VRLGEKITDFELSGYPVRIECGERDIENNMLVISSRITGEKQIISIDQVTETIERMMAEGQVELLKRSRERLLSNVVACETLEDI